MPAPGENKPSYFAHGRVAPGDVAWVRALLDRAPRQEAQLQPTD